MSLKAPNPPTGGGTNKEVEISGPVTVSQLAQMLGITPADVQRDLMKLGVLANINASVTLDQATRVAQGRGATVKSGGGAPPAGGARTATSAAPAPAKKQKRVLGPVPRPPVVVIMGHVDHGKTTLLDTIRRSRVVDQEFGGITQHIGAFQVEVPTGDTKDGKPVMKRITFLDTPGHAAFTSMRARGAKVADIAILVVAADDGVMPQTIEAIDHAKAADVPIVIAVNKVDKDNANPTRVLTELTEHELVPEAFGGPVGTYEISALENLGIDELLERVLLESELLELAADPSGPAEGTIIEARLDPGKGVVATVLVQSGTLLVGDAVVAGTSWGKIKAMMDDRGRRINRAGPSAPAEILGLSSVPGAGDPLESVENERAARQLAEARVTDARSARDNAAGRVSLERLLQQIQQGDVKQLNVVLKADVDGSVEAVRDSLLKLATSEVKVNVVRAAVGNVGENDILLASAANAIVLGFNVRIDTAARSQAADQGIDVRTFKIIYELIDAVTAAMKGLLPAIYREVVLGRAEVRATFGLPNGNTVAGCYIGDGIMRRGADVRVIRGGKTINEGHIDSLRHVRENVRELAAGYECGILVDGFNDFKEGDILEAFTQERVEREL